MPSVASSTLAPSASTKRVHHPRERRSPDRRFFFAPLLALSLFALAFAQAATAQQNSRLAAAVQKVMDRPEFAHANFGIEFFDYTTNTVLYSHDAQELFVPASTTKILTEGALLASLGPAYPFHTKIYATGPIDKKGRLKGDLILIASGDPNLSNRN